MATVVKDPDETDSYGFDWSARMDNETISTSTWAVPPGIVKVSDEVDGTLTKVLVAGGDPNVDYTLTNLIHTSAGRILESSITFMIREKGV